MMALYYVSDILPGKFIAMTIHGAFSQRKSHPAWKEIEDAGKTSEAIESIFFGKNEYDNCDLASLHDEFRYYGDHHAGQWVRINEA
jgi:hypothetical protein